MSATGPPTPSSSPTKALIPPGTCDYFFPSYICLPFHSLADLTDANIVMKSLNSTLFPGLHGNVQVHSGFANEHAQTISIILNQVKSLISRYSATSVTLVSILLPPQFVLIISRLVSLSEERLLNSIACSWPSTCHSTSLSKASVTLSGPLYLVQPFVFFMIFVWKQYRTHRICRYPIFSG